MDLIEQIKRGKIKRVFRTTKKLNAPDLISHITQRAAGKDPLFIEERDYLTMLALMKEISQKLSLNIYAFCLMPNHIHLLISPSKNNLYPAMRDLFSKYAIQFNRKYGRKGHLFGGPYRQSVCLNDSYLLAASLYIHLNPVKAHLVTDPVDYRWSSCSLYCQEIPPKSFIKSNFVLGMVSESQHKSREKYQALLAEGTKLKLGEILEGEDAIKGLHSTLSTLFPSIFKPNYRKGVLPKLLGEDLLDDEELEKRIRQLKEKNLMGKPGSRQAKKFLISQLAARGLKREEIAVKMGISRKTIYNLMNSPD